MAKLLTKSEIGLSTSNYQRVEVRKRKEDEGKLDLSILEFLNELKFADEEFLEELQNKLLHEVRTNKVLKFNKLLPADLLNESISEKVYDFKGLLKEIQDKIISQ